MGIQQTNYWLALVLVLLLFSRPVLAWNAAGHMVSASIAYDVLKQDDPAALARVLELLRQHPQYAERFADKLETVPADERDRFLFCLAARWPDDVRRNWTYHHGPWHYVNFPFVPVPLPDSELHMQIPSPNILTAYAENAKLVSGVAARGDKAIALCWVFHLVGDVHQPLHTVALFTSDYPEGDRGGNLVFVRAKPGGGIVNLHSLWDGLILGSSSYADAKNMGTDLRIRPAFAREKLTELAEPSFDAWAKESFELARHVAYLEGKPPGSPNRDDNTPAVPDGYNAKAKAAAERRMVLAGYRLAGTLAKAVK